MSETTTTTAPTTEVANLRDSRKELAAAKAPVKKAAAKKAPAKAAAKESATPASTSTKLRWVREDADKAGSAQHAIGADGTKYEIRIAGDKFDAVATKGQKTTVLAEGVSNGAAYSACVKAAKAVAK